MADKDIEQKIKLTYETNADETSSQVNKLSGSIEGVEDKQVRATKSTKESTEAHKKAAAGAKEQGAALETLGGGIGSTITAMKGMLKQMWLMIANPLVLTIVAIVGALALLFKAFTSTNDGADKMEQMMSGVSATIDILRDRFLKIAGAIVKFMTGDFKGAMADGKAAVSGFGAEVEKEFKQAANAIKELQEVEDAMRSLGETRAKLNRDLSAAKEIITDETATYAEKKKAINDVRKSEGEQTEQELANAKRKLKAIEELNSLSDTSDEDLKKASDARIAVYNLEKESNDNRRAINKADKRADSEESGRIKAIASERAAAAKVRSDSEKAAAKERKALLDAELKEYEGFIKAKQDAWEKGQQDLNSAIDKATEENVVRELTERDRAVRVVKDKYFELIEKAKQFGIDSAVLVEAQRNEIADIDKKVADDKAVKDKEASDKKATEDKVVSDAMLQQEKDIQAAKLNIAEQGIRLIANVFGKSKAIQKAAIIAENAVGIGKMIIANNLANIGALATPQAIATSGASAVPVIAVNNISTGIGVASTIAATAKALQSLGGGSAGGAGQSTAGGRSAGGASAAPQVNFQGSRENQIGNTLAGRLNAQAPIRVTVLESDISKAQTSVTAKVVSNSF
jgi:hypothetical protein